MTTLDEWARDYNIPAEAIRNLRQRMVTVAPVAPAEYESEASAQQQIRLGETKLGNRMWRNNVGVAVSEDGRHIRYGLANDSRQMNQRIKSSDLIGITPIVHAGRTFGVFTSTEVKRPGWRYTGTPRERAQLAWLELVISLGGIGKFSTGGEYK